MKKNEWLQNAVGIILVFILLIVCFAAAFYLTSFGYTITGYYPSSLIAQIVNSLLGLLFAIVVIKIALMFDDHKFGIFDAIIKAQKKIAEGDYNINLNNDTEGLGPYSDLVDSVNSMALELNKVEKMRQEFISNVSHEIQSPLTSIRGFTQALRNDKLSFENKLHFLNIIEAESMRLSKLSDNLLKLASLEAETIQIKPMSFRIDRQLRHIVLSLEPQWANKNINIEVHLSEIEVNADEDMISQVFINLIHNSIKFTPEFGDVKIDLFEQGESVICKITDTGIGITEEDQKYIFDRFFKADKSRTPYINSSGLGLSIVKKIIDMHHGTIKVKSKLGEETQFTITLPRNI